MSNRILHLAKDDKFINSANWQFEKIFPNQNEFRIYVEEKDKPLKYVEKKENITIYKESEYTHLISDLDDFDLVVLLGLDRVQSTVVLNAESNVQFLWLFFGAEIYSNSKAPNSPILGRMSKKLAFGEIVIDNIKEFVKPLIFFLKGSTPTNVKILKAANRINYFGVLYQEEYDLLMSRNILNLGAKLVRFTYYPIEFIFKDVEHLKISSNSILVGNSASISNNHLEAFELVKLFNLTNRKIVVPLSYGDSNYAKKIIKKGSKIFGNNFDPITEFMSLSEYNSMLSKCGIVIMNHYRQQAVGTVLALLWMGAKVYLTKKNTLFSYLRRINVAIFSIESDLNPEDVLIPLSESEIVRNKEILKVELGEKLILASLKKDIEGIFNEKLVS